MAASNPASHPDDGSEAQELRSSERVKKVSHLRPVEDLGGKHPMTVEARTAHVEEVKRKTGYYDRLQQAQKHAKTMKREDGEDYLDQFEEREMAALQKALAKEGRTELAHDFEEPITADIPVSLFEKGLKETKIAVEETLQPLELGAEDVLTKTGAQIIKEKSKRKLNGAIESGEVSTRAFTMSFHNGPVVGVNYPGIHKRGGGFAESADGMVAVRGRKREELTLVMTHGMGDTPEDAAISNAAAVTAAYDLNRDTTPHLPQLFNHMNETVNGVSDELGAATKGVSVLAARIHKDSPQSALYNVDVLSAGDNHCFVLDPLSGKVQSTTLQTVAGKLQEKRFSMKARKEIVRRLAEKEGLTPGDAEQGVIRWVGMPDEEFEPVAQTLEAAEGEIVVVASGAFMKSIGGAEFFQDGVVGRMIAKQLKEGKNLKEICIGMTKNTASRQQNDQLPEKAVSIMAYQVPGHIGVGKQAKENNQRATEEILKDLE